MKQIQITAKDKTGNEFTKLVKIICINNKPVIDFGWPIQYYIDYLQQYYPFTSKFVIDVGHQVYVEADVMNEIFKELVLNS